ncbi:MAG: hypothetical protein KME46_12680 [Brasilonema angustatum HA4187-MV1]|nr:hypothetical protein [Brasilonema angustatum HA4187-MV1]
MSVFPTHKLVSRDRSNIEDRSHNSEFGIQSVGACIPDYIGKFLRQSYFCQLVIMLNI